METKVLLISTNAGYEAIAIIDNKKFELENFEKQIPQNIYNNEELVIDWFKKIEDVSSLLGSEFTGNVEDLEVISEIEL